jgi:RND family efflux transporter MFP subunit
MNNKLLALLPKLKNKWVILSAGTIIVLGGIVAVRSRSADAQIEFVPVRQGPVIEEVNATGKVKAAQAVNLGLERGGKVVWTPKNVGEYVEPDTIIVQIANGDVVSELAQARASVQIQAAKLREIKSGTRPEALDISEVKVVNAEEDVHQAQINLLATLRNAYSSADDAIHNKVDPLYLQPRSSNPLLIFTPAEVPDSSLESGRIEVERRLNSLKSEMRSATTTPGDVEALSTKVKQDLGEIKLFLDNISLTVNGLSSSMTISAAQLSEWKSDISQARTSLNTAITSIFSAEDKVKAARAEYSVNNKQLHLDKAGSVEEQIEAQNAELTQAQAHVAGIQADLAKTYIRSPISGIITKQDAKIGEIAPANTVLVSIISDSKFEIEVNVPEADIAKIKVGQKASVTLDAYGPEVVFTAVVVKVDPAETVIDNVPTYKTTLQFDSTDQRIKSGMTANLDITGEAHLEALAVPQRAIVTRDGKRYIRLKTGESTTTDIEVKTGLRGADGFVEITRGLKAGDIVAINSVR